MVSNDFRTAVFLCGPITNVIKDGEFNAPIRYLIERIAERIENAGFAVLSAHREELFGNRMPERPDEIFRRDWYLAQLSKAIVLVFPSDTDGQLVRTDGTFMELGWAMALNKPLFIVTEDNAIGRSHLFDGLLDVAPNTQLFGLEEAVSGDKFYRGLRRVLLRTEYPTPHTRTVAFCCTSFGFGPVSKVVAVAEAMRLLRPDYRLVFIGSNINEQYARASNVFDDFVSIDVDIAPKAAVSEAVRYDALVNGLNFEVLSLWQSQMSPHFFLDSLTWMWPTIPVSVASARVYFVQDYLLGARISDKSLPDNTILVPPILSPSINTSRATWEIEDGYLLVNLSGLRNPILPPGYYARYVQMLLRGLKAALHEIHDRHLRLIRRVLVCGNNDLLGTDMGLDWSELPFPVELNFVAHHRFLLEMRRCELLLTSPGLTTTLEALALGVSCRFLLPQNYSQFRISMRYRSLGLTQLLWPEPFDTVKLSDPLLSEDEGVLEVSRLLTEYLERDVSEIAQAFLKLLLSNESEVEFEHIRQSILAWDGSLHVARRVVQEIEIPEELERGVNAEPGNLHS